MDSFSPSDTESAKASRQQLKEAIYSVLFDMNVPSVCAINQVLCLRNILFFFPSSPPPIWLSFSFSDCYEYKTMYKNLVINLHEVFSVLLSTPFLRWLLKFEGKEGNWFCWRVWSLHRKGRVLWFRARCSYSPISFNREGVWSAIRNVIGYQGYANYYLSLLGRVCYK